MGRFKRASIAALTVVVLEGCNSADRAASDTTTVAASPAADAAADEQAIRAVNPAWFKAHQAGDAATPLVDERPGPVPAHVEVSP